MTICYYRFNRKRFIIIYFFGFFVVVGNNEIWAELSITSSKTIFDFRVQYFSSCHFHFAMRKWFSDLVAKIDRQRHENKFWQEQHLTIIWNPKTNTPGKGDRHTMPNVLCAQNLYEIDKRLAMSRSEQFSSFFSFVRSIFFSLHHFESLDYR